MNSPSKCQGIPAFCATQVMFAGSGKVPRLLKALKPQPESIDSIVAEIISSGITKTFRNFTNRRKCLPIRERHKGFRKPQGLSRNRSTRFWPKTKMVSVSCARAVRAGCTRWYCVGWQPGKWPHRIPRRGECHSYTDVVVTF